MHKGQSQEGAAGSTNMQAGRDVVVQGVSLEEARQVALDVFRANFYEFRGIAEEVAIGRAEKITNEYLGRLASERPDSFENLQDPDVQRTLIRAQTEFACSGEADLENVLVDLLVDRTGISERDMRALALNEAIAVAPRMTVQQRGSVAAVFAIRYTRRIGLLPLQVYRSLIARDIALTGQHLSDRRADFQHLVSLGVGTISMGESAFGGILRQTAAGYFHKGFPLERIENIPGFAKHKEQLFIPCLRDPQAWQPAVTSDEDITNLVLQTGVAADLENAEAEIKNALEGFLFTPDEIVADLAAANAVVAEVARKWDTGTAKHFELSSTGIAIGHAYWQRLTGLNADLAIWL